MIRFVDGPATGKSLSLRRAPIFLRVVIDRRGTVDALDQLDDEPRPSETIHIYKLDEEIGTYFACTRGSGCRSGLSAQYRLHAEQPVDEVARDRERWSAWAFEQAKRAGLVPIEEKHAE